MNLCDQTAEQELDKQALVSKKKFWPVCSGLVSKLGRGAAPLVDSIGKASLSFAVPEPENQTTQS